jgi:hypothetical protein
VWWSTFGPPQNAAHAALRGLLLLRRLYFDPMHRFELTTCARWRTEPGRGSIRHVGHQRSPQCVSQVWESTSIQLADALYPVAQEAMRRGYYMPNRARSIAVLTGEA